MRTSTREEDPLDHDLSDRANLLFRAMDKNHDRKVSEADVLASTAELEQHMPGISVPEFIEFISHADTDGDKALNREELIQGIANGIEMAVQDDSPDQQETAPDTLSPGLIETGAATMSASRHRRNIFKKAWGGIKKVGKAIGKGVKSLFGAGKNAVKDAAQKKLQLIDKSQDGCVMCQYIVERCETNVKQSGVIPGMAQVVDPATIFLETESKPDPEPTVLLEVEQKQVNYDFMAANIIGSTRQSTRVQRQMERQKYNEIYRVVDITLDDVCEQGMPNRFYGYCKQIYKVQSDVVDGLRYQYRPTDICFRIGMCDKKSYITQGIHSRYK
jgi:hypothetical protein